MVPGYSDYRAYSGAIRKVLALWNPRVPIKPKDLRNTIQTAAIDGGWYGYYVQRYVGHVPSTIGERHYHGDRERRILPLLRDKVLSHIEEEISKWEAPEDSPILPGPRLVMCSNARS